MSERKTICRVIAAGEEFILLLLLLSPLFCTRVLHKTGQRRRERFSAASFHELSVSITITNYPLSNSRIIYSIAVYRYELVRRRMTSLRVINIVPKHWNKNPGGFHILISVSV